MMKWYLDLRQKSVEFRKENEKRTHFGNLKAWIRKGSIQHRRQDTLTNGVMIERHPPLNSAANESAHT